MYYVIFTGLLYSMIYVFTLGYGYTRYLLVSLFHNFRFSIEAKMGWYANIHRASFTKIGYNKV